MITYDHFTITWWCINLFQRKEIANAKLREAEISKQNLDATAVKLAEANVTEGYNNTFEEVVYQTMEHNNTNDEAVNQTRYHSLNKSTADSDTTTPRRRQANGVPL